MIFVTPVFWFVNDMPQIIREIFLLNPLATLMEISHKAILFYENPSLFDYTYGIISSVSVCILGIYLFKKTEKKLVEKL